MDVCSRECDKQKGQPENIMPPVTAIAGVELFEQLIPKN